MKISFKNHLKKTLIILFALIFIYSCKKDRKVIPPDNTAIVSAIDNEINYTFSQTFYIRPPGAVYGTGDGSSWTNAFSELPENLVRGAKYYFASGTYYSGPVSEHSVWHTFNDKEVDNKYIGIFKAIESDHGTDNGWEASFGEVTARLGPISFVTGNYVIEGQIGSKTSGYGFKLTTLDETNNNANVISFGWNTKSHHIVFSHLDIEHTGNWGFHSIGISHDAVRSNPADSDNPDVKLKYLYFQNCYLHDANRSLMMMLKCENILVENCWFVRSGCHQESNTIGLKYSKNVVFRRNVFIDAKNVFFSVRWVENVYIYSNIFICENEDGHWDIYSAVENTLGHARNIHVHGNTFNNLQGLKVGIRLKNDYGSVYIHNNLWANCETNIINLDGIHSHNAFYENYRTDGAEPIKLDEKTEDEFRQILTENPFVDAEKYNFQLSYETEHGKVLAAPFNIDFTGKIRGEDGVWDRGAFEY